MVALSLVREHIAADKIISPSAFLFSLLHMIKLKIPTGIMNTMIIGIMKIEDTSALPLMYLHSFLLSEYSAVKAVLVVFWLPRLFFYGTHKNTSVRPKD